MAGTLKRLAGPAYVASTATNIYNQSSALLYTRIYAIHVANITTGSVSFSLGISTTGDLTNGTNLFKGQAVGANTTFDYYPVNLRLGSADFLVGLDGNGAALVITVMGDLWAV